VTKRPFDTQESDEEPGERTEAGMRSGQGTRSLWQYMAHDAQRKGSSTVDDPPSMLGPLTPHEPETKPITYSVLVVHQGEAGANSTARALSATGFRTSEARDLTAALAAAPGVHAVILDVGVPAGMEITRRLRGYFGTAELPIIHLCADFRDQPQRRALAALAGADSCMGAPVQTEQLVAELDRLLAEALRAARGRSGER